MSRHEQPASGRLEVGADAEGRPLWLRWRGRRERARVCNSWRIEGAWWQGQPGGRSYHTVLIPSGVALVLYRNDPPEAGWYLERILD